SPFVQALSDSKGKGVDDMLDAKGMSFDKLRVPFRIERGIIDIGASKAQGPSLGLTFQGQVTQSMQQVNINGIIVPAYGLNSLFNKIPLVGDILLGGKDEGLFALTYRIEGPADNPKFTINPLSALAPGILRKIFEGRKGKVKQEDTPPATPTPSE
ncbi:MAG: AsmA-like C-terminal domain-containing protein, partial [Rhodospirillaceae bacterium]|nr:AsmA-like C-terminal domain-containing protein [Rhodospirillaceae bacterium]